MFRRVSLHYESVNESEPGRCLYCTNAVELSRYHTVQKDL